MTYIRDSVVPANRWFDFETFFSCSPKPVDFRCPHTDQLPQNNLSIIQACWGFLLWHQATGDARALAQGRTTGRLSLTLPAGRGRRPGSRPTCWAALAPRTPTPNGATRASATPPTSTSPTSTRRARASIWNAASPPCAPPSPLRPMKTGRIGLRMYMDPGPACTGAPAPR